jgi:hypothetical protein
MESRMKAKLLFLARSGLAAGCSLIWSPTATVKAFMAAAQKGDADGMTKLFSNKGIQKTASTRSNQITNSLQRCSKERLPRAKVTAWQRCRKPHYLEGKRVAFFYKNEAGTNSLKLVFDLSKEGPAWKIDEIGGVEKEQIGNVDQPAPGDSLRESVPPPPSPPQTDQVSSASPNNGPTPTNRAPISGAC